MKFLQKIGALIYHVSCARLQHIILTITYRTSVIDIRFQEPYELIRSLRAAKFHRFLVSNKLTWFQEHTAYAHRVPCGCSFARNSHQKLQKPKQLLCATSPSGRNEPARTAVAHVCPAFQRSVF